jgi:hypothetical protein
MKGWEFSLSHLANFPPKDEWSVKDVQITVHVRYEGASRSRIKNQGPKNRTGFSRFDLDSGMQSLNIR